MPESTLSPALAYTYCDQRCERCPLQSECEVAAASGGDQPLPATPRAYAEQRERRAELVHEALDERMAEAFLAAGARLDPGAFQAALRCALSDPLAEAAHDLEQQACAWLARWRSAWRAKALAPVREAGLIEALDALSLAPPLIADRVVRALWLAAVRGPSAEVEAPEGQAKTASVALLELRRAWRRIARCLPLADAHSEQARCEELLADLVARFPRVGDFRRPGLDR